MKLDFQKVLFCAVMLICAFAATRARAIDPITSQGEQAAPGSNPSSTQLPPITVQFVQPSSRLPYITAIVALIGSFITALFSLRRGRMDARYTYAAEILKFRLRQIEEFYAPAYLLIEQSRIVYEKLRWTIVHEKTGISIDGFRLLDHIYEFKSDSQLKPLVDRVLAIGKQLTELISQKSGLIEGGITPTFIEYQGHFEILNAASEQNLTSGQKEGWHELGYYPRMLNREILEGYKVVLAHLENYAHAGDQIIPRLLNQKTVEAGKYRRQLLENLRFYESRAKEYAAKFDTFDVSGIRQHFIEAVERTHSARLQTVGNGVLKILDAGCGTGRDAREFVNKGYAVTAIDASPAMLRECTRKLREARNTTDNAEIQKAALASRSLEMTFDEIQFRNEFDGVWAAASLLHVPLQQMNETLQRLLQALKVNGILYMSLKYGGGEHEYDARFYSYYSRKRIRALLRRLPDVDEIQIWLSDAKGKNLSKTKQFWAWCFELFNRYDRSYWLNVLVARRRV